MWLPVTIVFASAFCSRSPPWFDPKLSLNQELPRRGTVLCLLSFGSPTPLFKQRTCLLKAARSLLTTREPFGSSPLSFTPEVLSSSRWWTKRCWRATGRTPRPVTHILTRTNTHSPAWPPTPLAMYFIQPHALFWQVPLLHVPRNWPSKFQFCPPTSAFARLPSAHPLCCLQMAITLAVLHVGKKCRMIQYPDFDKSVIFKVRVWLQKFKCTWSSFIPCSSCGALSFHVLNRYSPFHCSIWGIM